MSRSRRPRSAEALRRQLRDIVEGLGPRELDHLAAFGEFLRTRSRASRPSSKGRDRKSEPARAPPEPPQKGEPAKAKPAEDAPSSSKVTKLSTGSD